MGPQEAPPFTTLVCLLLGLHRGIFTGRLKAFERFQNAVGTVMAQVSTIRDQLVTRYPTWERTDKMIKSLHESLEFVSWRESPMSEEELSDFISSERAFTRMIMWFVGSARELPDEDARNSVAIVADGFRRDPDGAWN